MQNRIIKNKILKRNNIKKVLYVVLNNNKNDDHKMANIHLVNYCS